MPRDYSDRHVSAESGGVGGGREGGRKGNYDQDGPTGYFDLIDII